MKREPRPPASLRDVAREAGVHASTVSRVLNHAELSGVGNETRERVEEAAVRLRYRPNAQARGLKMSATGALGYLLPSLRNTANSPIVWGALERAWERGHVVLIAEDSGSIAAHEAYERLVEERRIDGLLINSARLGDPFFDHVASAHVPCVFVDRGHSRPGRNVVMREHDAGRLAVEHFLELGHAQIAHLTGPRLTDTVLRRREGFEQGAAAAGLEPVVIEAELDEQEGRDAFERLAREHPQVTAIYIANIHQAVGFVGAAHRHGVAIPAGLSVLSHDDDPVLEYGAIPISAIRMPLAALGATAVDALLGQIAGEAPRDILLEQAPRLVDRGSTGRR